MPSERAKPRVSVRAAIDQAPLEPPKQGSGAYTRELLQRQPSLTPAQIVELVHQHYPGSKATVKDVYWNRRKAEQLKLLEKQAAAAPASIQELRTGPRLSNDPERTYDQSSLRVGAHGKWVHRDYGAHFFRWGFAGRFVNAEVEVLDVGCGPDCAMIDALTMPRNNVPKRYVGVDLNKEPRKTPSRGWATLCWEFNFLERYGELGLFDLAVSFEVIEHMRKPNGERLLHALKACLRPSGTLLLSTPVFNGKAAANHLHEWTIPELRASIEAAGLAVVRRHGTFASHQEIKKAARPEELALVARLAGYYSGEVLSCFLAPLYPDASRNNVWVLQHA